MFGYVIANRGVGSGGQGATVPMKSGQGAKRGQIVFASFGPFDQKLINFGHFQRYISDNCVVLPSAAKLSAVQLDYVQLRGEGGQLFFPIWTFANKMIHFGHFQRYFSDNCVVLPSAAKLSAVQLDYVELRGKRGKLFCPIWTFAKKMINFGQFQRYFSDNCVVLPSAAKVFVAKGRKRASFLTHMGPLFRQ